MVRISTFLLSSISLLSSVLAAGDSAVIDLTPDNFDSIVNTGKPALVEFFAPWCGHCKNLAPVYEELATGLAWAKDKVTVAKVDADEHKVLGKKYGISGFPTIKWFDGKSDTPEDYSGGRDLPSLNSFITTKTGIRPKAKRGPASEMQMLNDKSFTEKVGGDQNVFVAFTAPWCGHCKSLAPTWESLAADFAAEPTVLVAKVDAEAADSKATAQKFEVKSYPTIKFFPAGSTEPLEYRGGRAEKDLVKYLNGKAGTFRKAGGGLNAQAGTIETLDTVVAKLTGGADIDAVSKELTTAAKGIEGKYAEYYVKVAGKLQGAQNYVDKELKRLEGLLGKGGLAQEKADDLVSRSNILRKFIKGEEATEEEVEEGGRDEL